MQGHSRSIPSQVIVEFRSDTDEIIDLFADDCGMSKHLSIGQIEYCNNGGTTIRYCCYRSLHLPRCNKRLCTTRGTKCASFTRLKLCQPDGSFPFLSLHVWLLRIYSTV
jgi:hypothetical protein